MSGLSRLRLAAAAAAAAALVRTACGTGVQVASPRICSGSEREVDICDGLPECNDCVPVDCVFGDWADWHSLGGCSQLCMRKRGIQRQNNECGKVCNGDLEEAKRCPDPSCEPPADQNCTLSSWSAWSPCSDELGQRTRQRTVLTPQAGSGSPCEGSLDQTEPCGSTKKVDCEFTAWGSWTPCDKTCGGGHQAQLRQVKTAADLGGAPCEGVLRRTRLCNVAPCVVTTNCQLSEWEDWSSCPENLYAGSGAAVPQRSRARHVAVPAASGGQACSEATSQTEPCPVQEPPPCELSAWAAWLPCDKTCGGGQTYRRRELTRAAAPGGRCAAATLSETRECNVEACGKNGADCLLSDWGAWTPCSVPCGVGDTMRGRQILRLAQVEGVGCSGALNQTKSCMVKECESAKDCEWDQWEDWSACSRSCGGGHRHRQRTVKQAPYLGGKACEAMVKDEMGLCSTQPCTECKDGRWGDWSEWSSCPAKCGVGLRSRHRDVVAQPNDCGKSLEGLEDEYEACHAPQSCTEDLDCMLTSWSDWSDCSCSCFGMRQRVREVSQYASGNGAPCLSENLKQVKPCNPVPGQATPPDCAEKTPRACEFGPWSSWGKCSASCEGGQTERTRTVLTPSAIDGKPCEGEVRETMGCNMDSCNATCLDCVWSEWEEWHGCSKCTDQKYRRRSVSRPPNYCGKPCDLSAAKEVTSCTGFCEPPSFCAWSEWSDTACPSHCGAASRLRRRTLSLVTEAPSSGYLAEGTHKMVCGGSQVLQVPCPVEDCERLQPVDCVFQQWDEWSAPSSQLCSRKRNVAVENMHGGTPCAGPLEMTKPCLAPKAKPEDCEFSPWRDWSGCPNTVSQAYRDRVVVKVATDGGASCAGLLRETQPCGAAPDPPEDCVLEEWAAWSQCSATCGAGTHKRSRGIRKRARNGGVGCKSELEQIDVCSDLAPCDGPKADCEFGTWGAWSACDALTQQEERSRAVLSEAASGGESCKGKVREVRPCVLVQDCRVSDWTSWDVCDRGCGGGQQVRQRQVVTNPSSGGKPCPEDIVQTRGCNTEPCAEKVDCTLSDWSVWGPCSASCGVGQQYKSRSVVTEAAGGGHGCTGDTVLTQQCSAAPCAVTDCVMGLWTDWSGCTCSCGGGQHTRSRSIQVHPSAGGKPCDEGLLTEVAPCNTRACSETCVDGLWGDWGLWDDCSSTCAGGITSRSRSVIREANECGAPPEGDSREMALCNEHVPCEVSVDCALTTWGVWSACTEQCNGIKRRSRDFSAHASGKGKPCKGPLLEVSACNPAPGEPTPDGCDKETKADCVVSDWTSWGYCSVTCGVGQVERTRRILTAAKLGGTACPRELHELDGCNPGPCPVACKPQDCEWNDWSEWGACMKCNGERRQTRSIKRQAACGGEPCDFGASERMGNCTRACSDPTFCSWAGWSAWSTCSNTCGKATRDRTRLLQATSVPLTKIGAGATVLHDEAGLRSGLEQLEASARTLESRRLQELVVSFGCGLAACAFLGAFLRARGRSVTYTAMPAGAQRVAVE